MGSYGDIRTMTRPADDPGQPESHSEEGGGKGPTTPRSAPLIPDLELREIRRGTKPGSRYVRLTPRKELPFRRVGEGEFQATKVAIRPRSGAERLWLGFKRI